jgi:DNA polymerase
MIAAARVETKSTLAEGRMERLIAASRFGAIPFPLRYAGAHTNRFSGDWKWNLQNLPKHKDPKNGKREALRDALKAPEGHMIIAIDSSQVEARVTAWLAGEQSLMHLFATGGDPYCDFASIAYNRTITKKDVVERFVGKGCVLGLGFGMGAPKLKDTLRKPVGGVSAEVSEQEAKRLVDTYRMKYRQINKFWDDCKKAITAMYHGVEQEFGVGAIIRTEHQALVLPSGNKLYYPKLTYEEGEKGLQYTYIDREGKKTKRIYGGLLCENIVQSVARDIICWQMVKAKSLGYNCVGTVHDELIFVVPESTVEADMETLTGVMKSTPKWAAGCPISCEGAYATSYGET